MEFILDRDSSGNWWDVSDKIHVLIGFPASNAREVIQYLRKLFPEALIRITV